MSASSSNAARNPAMPDVFLSLGSNVDREKHITSALTELDDLFGPLVVSSIYESEAEGFEGEPFYNLAVKFHSKLPVDEIAAMLREVEVAHGRAENSRKFEPRKLDIDLILYGDLVSKEGGHKIPRDEIARYAFMLEPLAEIAPDYEHPTLGMDFASLWNAFDKRLSRQRRLELHYEAGRLAPKDG
jgi:2-amino-4-hydroxy-6-hydroxymethyldihydropteridine diphosphokinase